MRLKLDMTVIIVDWSVLSVWDYWKASKGNSNYVANAIHATILELAQLFGMSENEKEIFLRQMLLMGHSFGAHIAGLVGKLLKESTGGMMAGTIVGLDAAGPKYSPLKTERHCLTHQDAMKVLMLHTCTIFFGIQFLVGHEDYFVNGGAHVLPKFLALSHVRSVNLFRELIWIQAIGYGCSDANRVCDDGNLKKHTFDLSAPIANLERTSYPIYLPTNLESPYFDNNKKPDHIPSYKVTMKKTWQIIVYKEKLPEKLMRQVLRFVRYIS